MVDFRSPVTPHTGYATSRSLFDQARQGMGPIISRVNGFMNWLGSDVVPDVMVEAMEPTMDLSDHYAPKDTMTMVNSRYNEKRGRNGSESVEFGYNRNGEAPYTIFVHESPQVYHAPPTQHKFLQRALDEETPELIGRIAAGIKRRARM